MDEKIKDLLKALGGEEITLDQLKHKLSGKSKIADAVCDALGDEVLLHISHNCDNCRDKWTHFMSVLCALLDDGKILLRKEDK